VEFNDADCITMFRSIFRRLAAGSRVLRRAARSKATVRTLQTVSRTRAAITANPRRFAVTAAISTLALTSVGVATAATAFADDVPFTGKPGTAHERTFIAVKPDGVQRGIVGDIIQRFESKGYRLVGIKLVHPTPEFAAKHYDDLKTKPFFGGLVKFFSSGPVVAMVWQGKGVVAGGRRLLGATNPDDSAPGTIRGDLCVTVGRNICHGSDAPDSAQDEIKLWFTEKEVVNWQSAVDPWVYDK